MTTSIMSLLSAAALKEHTANGTWGDETIYGIVRRHAGERPDSIAVRDSWRAFTWRMLADAIDAFAADLRGRGVRRGQRILVWAPNRIETIVALIAASRNGFVCCPSPHRNHTVEEIVDLAERASCAAFVYQTGFGSDADRNDIRAPTRVLPSLRHFYELAPLGPDCADKAPFDGLLEHPVDLAGKPVSDPNCVTYLAFTSGSTGKPKGVMHSDNTQLVSAHGIANAWSLGSDTVTLSLSPFAHNLGCGTLWTSIVAGGTFVLHDWARGESLLDRLIETKTDYLVGVPTHAMDLLAELKSRGIAKFDQLLGFRVSAAACPEHVAAELLDHGILPQKGYGMTETNGHQYTLPGDTRAHIVETSGICCPGYEIRIFDPDDSDVELPRGQVGQVAGKGGALMLGYFDDQTATENALNSDGWFMTGDLGVLDDEGYLRITGRKKEVIIRGGHNISPQLIEEIALRHDAIEFAAALPVPHDRLGEQACLVVSLVPGRSASAAEVLDHLAAEGLSRYDMPEFWIRLDRMPLMPNGKVQRMELVRRIRTGEATPEPVTRKETA